MQLLSVLGLLYVESPLVPVVLLSLNLFCTVAYEEFNHHSLLDILLLFCHRRRVPLFQTLPKLQLLLQVLLPKGSATERALMVIVDYGSLGETVAAEEVPADEYLHGLEEDIQADGALVVLVNVLFLEG